MQLLKYLTKREKEVICFFFRKYVPLFYLNINEQILSALQVFLTTFLVSCIFASKLTWFAYS